MSSRVPLILARYRWDGERGGLSRAEQLRQLELLQDARPIAYRKADPRHADDFDTYIMAPKARTIGGYECLVWTVVRDIHQRQIVKADRRRQQMTAEFVPTDESESSEIVAIPRLRALAAEDATGQGKLGGWSALQRFREIVAQHCNQDFEPKLAGTPQDFEKAIRNWDLSRFSFQARPFNPHPARPGEQLSDMMAKDGVGRLRGEARPKEGGHIRPDEDGIVNEAMGLAEKGYASVGAEAKTPSGAQVVFKRPSFSENRDKNLERQRNDRTLRVYIESGSEARVTRRTVEVLAEFFDEGE